MTQSHSFVSNFTNLLTSPRLAFAAIKEQPRVLLALLLIVATASLWMLYYFLNVDFPWLIDSMISNQSVGKSAEEAEAIRKGMSNLSPMIMGGSTLVGALLGAPIVFAIYAVYFLLVNKAFDEEALGFKHWYSLVCWSSIPAIFTSLASFVNFLLADNGQLSLEHLNPISFNNLFFHLTPADPLFGPLSSWDPMVIWSTVLLVIGYQQWMQKSIAKSTAIVLAPTLVIYGAWIAFALR